MASRTIPRSYCSRTGMNLGLSDSIDLIMSEIFLAWTEAAMPVQLRTEAKQDLYP